MEEEKEKKKKKKKRKQQNNSRKACYSRRSGACGFFLACKDCLSPPGSEGGRGEGRDGGERRSFGE